MRPKSLCTPIATFVSTLGCARQRLDRRRTDPVAGRSPSCSEIALSRVVGSLADLAGLVVPSVTPPTRHRSASAPREIGRCAQGIWRPCWDSSGGWTTAHRAVRGAGAGQADPEDSCKSGLVLQIDAAFKHLLPLRIPIAGKTTADRRIFVDADAESSIRRLVIVQYETVNPGVKFSFVYPARRPPSLVPRRTSFTLTCMTMNGQRRSLPTPRPDSRARSW